MSRSDKPEICLILDAEQCRDAQGKAVPFYTYNGNDYAPDTIFSRHANDATAEQLAALCDHDAENCNAHDCVGMHRLLGALLYRFLGRWIATKVMLEIAQRRGLHGMAGLVGIRDSYKELGVGPAGHDWEGKFK